MKRVFLTIIALSTVIGCSKKIPPEVELYSQAQQFEISAEYNKALETYQTILDNYKSSPNNYKAVFMIGYINYEYLKDYQKAIALFDKLIADYPTCDLADDATVLRDSAKSGKDIMTEFQDSTK